MDRTIGYRISRDITFDLGSDAGEPFSVVYHGLFDFTVGIKKVIVKLNLGENTTEAARLRCLSALWGAPVVSWLIL